MLLTIFHNTGFRQSYQSISSNGQIYPNTHLLTYEPPNDDCGYMYVNHYQKRRG
jgi:hypothetical protein